MIKLKLVPPALAAVVLFAALGRMPARGGFTAKPTPPGKPPQAEEAPNAPNAPNAPSAPNAPKNEGKPDAAGKPEDAAVALRQKLRAKLIGFVADSALEIPQANMPDTGGNRQKLVQALDDAEKKATDVPVVIRGTLELLTRYTPEADFSNRLWRTAAAIEYWQRAANSNGMQRLFDGILELCALLPKDDEANSHGTFLRATVLSRQKNFDAAGAILTELRDRAGLPEDFHVSVIAGLGDNAAARHDYDAAVSNWESLADFPGYPVSVQSLLAAVFVDLERGKRPDAYRVLDMLRRFSPENIKASPVGLQANELLKLSENHAESDAFWDGGAKWWPDWLEVDRKLGPSPAPEELMIPLIPSVSRLGMLIGRAAQQNDTVSRARGFREAAHAARWQPSMLVELTELFVSLPQLQMTSVAPEYRRFVISVYERGHLADPALRRSLCCMAASAYIDSQSNDKAQAVLHEFASLPAQDDNFARVASRLACLAALNTGKGLEDAAASSEQALESSAYDFYRAQGVNLLSHVYERMGKGKDALALVDRELKQPSIQKDAAGLRLLEGRRQELQNLGAPAGKISEVVKAWLGEIQLPWFDFSKPHALSDPTVGDIDQSLTLGTSAVTPAEQMKLAVLVLEDDAQPEKRKLSAAWIVGFYCCAFAPDSETANRWAGSFLDSDKISGAVRGAFFSGCALRAFAEDDATLFQDLVKHPVRKMLNLQAGDVIEELESYFAACKTGNTECVQLGETLLRKPFTGAAQDVFQHLVVRLSNAGEFEKAKGLIDALGAISPVMDPDHARTPIQFTLGKVLAHDQKWHPVNVAIRDLVLARFGKDEPPAPPVALHSDYRIFSLNFPADEATRVRLQAIRKGRFTAQCDYFWALFMRDLQRSDENFALRSGSLRAALKSAADDGTRAEVIQMFTAVLDIDSPEERAAAAEMLEPLRKENDQPKTADALREFDLIVGLRTGTAVDVRAALATIKEDQSKRTAEAGALGHAVADGDEPLMRFLIESVSPQELLSDRMIAASLPAYRLLGMKEEAALAEQSAKEAVYRMVMEFWMSGNDGPAHNAYETAETLGDESLIPRAMAEKLIASRRNELTKLSLDGEESMFRQDWERTLKVCEQALRGYPTYYHFYFLQGKAFAALKRTDEALRSLQSYIATVHDEPDVREAKVLIDKLSKKAGDDKGAAK